MGSRVYVGGIPYETRERDLESFFRGFGRIRDVLIKNGYGFVEFDDYRDAEDAVYELHGKKLHGVRVSVEMARGRPRGRDQEWFSSRDRDHGRPRQGPPVRTNYRLFVENLSSGVSWQDLKDFLRPAGEVTFADAHKKYKNEGIVEFASYDDMKNAIRKFDDAVLNGRRIRLVEDKSSGNSRRSRSRSRSRSKSRSSSADSRKRARSRSKSSRSPVPKKEKRSRSKSRDRSRSRRSQSRHESKDRSTSRSPTKRQSSKRSRSRSASGSPEKRFKDKSVSRSRSRSRTNKRDSRSKSKDRRSRSRSPDDKKSRSRSRSRS
ncbi:serine/arginine-rich splicing factor 5-like isoform X2 [Anthonomus grandis grandis]|uniref:serine/arginine-rich splicing factor 5-like isoform X2 n=1 Tax=Anthonomus grandis grandis TaxID=2921223 RepID=UPI0021667FD3|nr:serine/arginine-rich splicing factor 5-like isoform X2 [Anthonomus grandis grandis]